MRKAKIIATLGPSTQSLKQIKNLIRSGVNVFRLNFSHSDHEYHKQLIVNVRKASVALDCEVAIMQDISGPKIRICQLDESIELKCGDTLNLSKNVVDSALNTITISYPEILNNVKVGESIFFADGTIRTKVKKKTKNLVICEVDVGGTLHSKKGVNFPQTKLNISNITQKDIDDLHFASKNEIDIVALSFVSKKQDVLKARKILNQSGSNPMIIAKIEKPEAIDNIDSIIDVCDGVMIARGDLGVELGVHMVPRIQKMIIEKANQKGLVTITATQMLTSMINSPYPTRAEVSDVANAILDGSDAVMLSDETTIGNYAVEAIEVLNKTIKEAEKIYPYYNNYQSNHLEHTALAAITLSKNIDPSILVSFTKSGKSALQLSKFRPSKDILVCSYNLSTIRKMQIVWGVNRFVHISYCNNEQALLKELLSNGLQTKMIKRSKIYICVLGYPFEVQHNSNQIKIIDEATIDFLMDE